MNRLNLRLAPWALGLWVALCAGTLGAQETSARCEAAIDQAAGRYSACLLRADAHFKRKPNANRYENRQGRCGHRYDRETRRAIRRHSEEACASIERLSAIADRTERYTENVSREVQDEDAIDLVYVQSGTGAALTDSMLTLSGIHPKTGWVTEQTQSDAGQILTADFLDFFNQVGPYSFFENQPRAELTCEVDASPESFSVVLREAAYDSELQEITYAIDHADTSGEEAPIDPITCDGDASLFIDPEPCVPAGSGCTLSPPTNNQLTVALLNRMNWDKSTPDWVVEPGPKWEQFDERIYCPLKQINSFAVFGDWFYQCLQDDDDLKKYLAYFVASAYASEEFIWRTPGVMPVYYKSALPLIRGSNEYLPESSTWTTDSDRGKEFPVLNSGAADTVIAIVMKEFSKAHCSIGFGQWQQTHVSGSILSPPWARPVDTDQNPVVMQDIDPVIDVGLNVNRHKLVLGPITWLAMALDVENWKNTEDKSVFDDQIALGQQKWKQIHDNVHVNEAICKAIPKKDENCGPFPPEINKVVAGLMPDLCTPPQSCSILKQDLWQAAIRAATAAFREDMCVRDPINLHHDWSHLNLPDGKNALNTALTFLEDRSEPHGGPSTEAINNAAMAIQEFYFGPNQESPRQPFTKPLVAPVYPPVPQLPTN